MWAHAQGADSSAAEVATDQVVHAVDLTRRYGEGATTVDALRGVSLDVGRGDLVAVMGPSGSGKSTLMHLLAGLDQPTSGTVTIGGVDLTQLDDRQLTLLRRDHVGFVFQFFNLLPMLSAEEDVLLPLSIAGEKPDPAFFEDLMERVGLTHAGDRKVRTYSGGMKRRLDLALALIHDPSILFLDEPTTGLDPQSRTSLWEEVGRLAREEGVTVFLTTQYLEEADQVCDRLAIIDAGVIVREGTPSALKTDLRVRLGLEREVSLDDVFLDATGRTRDEALARLRRAVGETVVIIEGGTTNKSFVLDLLDAPEVIDGSADTGWIDRVRAEGRLVLHRHSGVALVAAGIAAYEEEKQVEIRRLLDTAHGGRPQVQHRVGRPIELRLRGNAYRVAVAQVGPLEFGGFIAWLAWLVLHLVYLVGFKTKITTLISWTVTFLSARRGQLTITEQQAFARTRIEQLEEIAQVSGMTPFGAEHLARLDAAWRE